MHCTSISFCSDRICGWRTARLTAIAAAAFLVAGASARAATWDHVHGDAANSGFANVVTAPALHPLATVPGIGTYAPGAGPVIGPDGTVYLGSQEGVVRALHPDGSPFWSRSLGPPTDQIITSSPVVDTDGSIYVTSVRTYTDNSAVPPARRHETRLYRFDPGGALLWVVQLPIQLPSESGVAADFGTVASPNILRDGQTTAILVQAIYLGQTARDLDLLAYSPNGGLLAKRLISGIAGQPFGDGGIQLSVFPPLCFRLEPADPFDRLPATLALPLPGVAVAAPPGGSPRILTTDQYRTTEVWELSPTAGFIEVLRQGLPAARIASLPMMLPDGTPVLVTDEVGFDDECSRFVDEGGQVTFSRLDGVLLADAGFRPGQGGMAARTADSRVVVTHSFGMEVTYSLANNPHDGTLIAHHIDYPAQTVAPPAVSRSHIFVSTAGSFRTYDARTLAEVGEVDWNGGGLSGAAIGPQGRVYALASNVLFIWPEPTCTIRALCIGTLPGPVVTIRGPRSGLTSAPVVTGIGTGMVSAPMTMH